MGKNHKTQIGARINKPLDDRLQVLNLTELFNNVAAHERYNGMRVYVESESRAYHFILGTNSMLFTDNLNRVAEPAWIQAQLVPIDILYSSLLNLAMTGTLLEGAQYRITDYQTTNNVHADVPTEQSCDVESLVVQANSATDINPIAHSESAPHDTIIYNMRDNYVPDYSTYPDGERDTGASVPGGDPMVVAVTGANTFTVDRPLIDNYNLYLYIADDAEELEITRGQLNVAEGIFVRQTGASLREVTVPSYINLLHANAYIYAGSDGSLSARTGFIQYRKNNLHDVEANFDYKAKVARYALDLTGKAWNAGTTYAKNDWVENGGKIFVSLKDSNLNNSVNGVYWTDVFEDATAVQFPYGITTLLNGMTLDLASVEILPVLTYAGAYDVGVPKTYGFGNAHHIKVERNFAHEVPNVRVLTTDAWTENSIHLHAGSNRASISGIFEDSSISGPITNSILEGIIRNMQIGQIDRSIFHLQAQHADSIVAKFDRYIGGNHFQKNVCGVLEEVINGGQMTNNTFQYMQRANIGSIVHANSITQYVNFDNFYYSFQFNKGGYMTGVYLDSTAGNQSFTANDIGKQFTAVNITNTSFNNNKFNLVSYVDFSGTGSDDIINNVFGTLSGQNSGARTNINNSISDSVIMNLGVSGQLPVTCSPGANIVRCHIIGENYDNTYGGDMIDCIISGQWSGNVTSGQQVDCKISGTVTGSTIGNMTKSTVVGDLLTCTIAGFVNNHVIGVCSNVDFGTGFDDNKLTGTFTDITFGNGSSGNILDGLITPTLTAAAMLNNTLVSIPNLTDFTTATLIYASQTIIGMEAEGGTPKLTYLNSTGNMVVADITD